MKLEEFKLDPSGLYVGDGKGTPAGYLDGAEKYLCEVLEKSKNKGILSTELKEAVKDWPSLYHLSPYRVTILDCLDFSFNNAEILELGAGCGAISRWLGDESGKVTAIEGNYHRAQVAGIRCSDLSNVRVHVANFFDLSITNHFDVATLIGVLEYSHLYHPEYRDSPYKAALSNLRFVFDSLKNTGVLILALENKMGLKYFGGAREDHSGRVFDSIQGYPRKDSAVTYSAYELEKMLREAGFSETEIYLPFPDYKLATTILNGQELSPKYYPHNWIETPFSDRCTHQRSQLFNESLVLRELSKSNLMKEFANSFLFVAYKGERPETLNDRDRDSQNWVAKHYSLGRSDSFCKKVTLIKSDDASPLVRNDPVAKEKARRLPEDSMFNHLLEPETFYPGDQLLFSVFEMLAFDNFELRFTSLVGDFIRFLIDTFSAGRNDEAGVPLIRGDAFDVMLWNVIVEEGTGEWKVIDKEWSFKGVLPVDFIIWRNIFQLILRHKAYFREPLTEESAREFTIKVIRAFYPAFSSDRYNRAKQMEDYFHHYVSHGQSPEIESLPIGKVTETHSVQMPLKGDNVSEGNDTDSMKVLAARNEPLQSTCPMIKVQSPLKYLQKKRRKVSIIIPVLNNLRYTKQCFEALSLNTKYEPYEVICIDNASTDGTGEFLKCLEGDIKIITNRENLGFGKSCNQGARAAEGEFLVFLNNDTIPEPDWLESLVNVAAGNPEVAVVGSKLLYPDNRVQHAGVVFAYRESGLSISHIYRGIDRDHPAVNYLREYNAVTAACMLVKRAVFLDLDMFDEGFLNGYEDVDFCLRVREKGLKVFYNPESTLYHFEETTEGRLDHGDRNTRHFLSKWHGKIQPDEETKVLEDGFRIEYLPDNCVRINLTEQEEKSIRNDVKKCEYNKGNKKEDMPIEKKMSEMNLGGKNLKKIAIVRGANLNKWEMQNYEPLTDFYDMTAYTTSQHSFDIGRIEMPIQRLPFQSQGLLLEMQGLEDHLADKDLVYSADITYRFSAQAVEAKQNSGCKVVCLEWENIPFNYDEYPEVHEIKESVRRGADHFIAVTERAKEALLLEGVAEEKIDVVSMGVDLNLFKPDTKNVDSDRAKFGIGRDETIVLYIGRMVWEKGIYDLIHGAAAIVKDDSMREHRVRFLIVGKGPELEGVRERAACLGIDSRIIFLEEYPYEEMGRLHNLADIFVLPSISTRTWQEQFGMVIIESMACGKPVISTRSGSIPEVVGDDGILIQPNDHLSLYGAIKTLVLDQRFREELGARALSRAKERFDAQKTAEKIRIIFEKVLNRETEEERMREHYMKGMQFWKEGKREEGFETLFRTFEEDPDRKNVLDSIVQTGMELKRYDAVEKAIREYLIYHPANLDALASLAQTLVVAGKIDQAEKELGKVFIFDRDNRRAVSIMKKIEAARKEVKV